MCSQSGTVVTAPFSGELFEYLMFLPFPSSAKTVITRIGILAELFLAQNCSDVAISSLCVEVINLNCSLNNSFFISVYCSNISG